MNDKAGKRAAQERVDRIRVFRRELADLLHQGVLELSGEQRAGLDAHLDQTLADLASRFDVDVSDSQKRISLGMRILSTLGGLAFCAALFLFFFRFWGGLSIPVQIGILAATPLLGLALMQIVSRRDKTSYYTSLVGLVVLASFIMNLVVVGSIFNTPPSHATFLGWGVFALILAYGYGLRLPLGAGLVLLLVFGAASVAVWTGGYWVAFLNRPEAFLIMGVIIAVSPFLIPHRKLIDFPGVFYLVGLVAIFLPVWILVHHGELSYLTPSVKVIQWIYRAAGFAVAGGAIWCGIRKSMPWVMNLGSAFFAMYLFDQLFSWWWDWMPKYLFFLIIGLIALLLLAVFQKLRTRTRESMA